MTPSRPDGARALYHKWSTDREHFLRRARECARYTIPSVCPPDGFNATSDLPTPWQGLGERGVRNLASKILLVMLPPGAPFLKLGLSSAVEQEAKQTGTKGDFDRGFSTIERAIAEDIESTNAAVSMYELARQLIVTGNALKHYQPDGGFLVYRLPEYVVRRDGTGATRTIILKQQVSKLDIDPAILRTCNVERMSGEVAEYGVNEDKVDVYTVVRRGQSSWEIHQEINDVIVPNSQGSDPLDYPSWVPVRMVSLRGEHYGRSYVEEVLGDLTTYDGLSRSIAEGAAAMAKLLLLRRPGATVRESDLKKPNLSIVTGNPDDVHALQIEKYGDFRVALELARDLKARLEQSFLLTSSVQRDAERVTAEEVRLMASELDDALGGMYSTLAQEVQRPFAKFQLKRIRDEGRLDKTITNDEFVKLKLVTGLHALGRGHDLTKLRGAINDTAQMAQFAEQLPEMDRTEAAKRIFASWGIDTDGLILEGEALQAKLNQQAMAQQVMPMMMDALKSGAATQLTKAATEQPQ